MARNKKHQSITSRIAELKNSIRQKYRNFKLGNIETEQLLEKQYKPIVTELRKERPDVKLEPKEEENADESYDDEINFKPDVVSTPKGPKFIRDSEVFESHSILPSVSQLARDPSTLQDTSQYVKHTFHNPLTRKYMLKFMKGEAGGNNKIDNIYGPRIDDDRLMVGNSPVTFDDEGNIIINGIQYRGTEGLYELLFKRQPDDSMYNTHDLNAYRDVLLKTNAHKKGYLASNHINRPANSIKYKTVVSSLFPKPVHGRGLKSVHSRDMSYWDNPNELCARLRLLTGSAEAGNTAHRNEIQNIIEELREAGVISGHGNSRYRSLLV